MRAPNVVVRPASGSDRDAVVEEGEDRGKAFPTREARRIIPCWLLYDHMIMLQFHVWLYDHDYVTILCLVNFTSDDDPIWKKTEAIG